jgi:hypothetical protein
MALDEAEEEYREQGSLARHPSGNGLLHRPYPICFISAFNLREELRKDKPKNFFPKPEEVVALLNLERECPSTPWRKGRTPKEHQEMMLAEELRKWQDEQRDRERRWQEGQRERDIKREQEQREADLKRQQEQRKEDLERDRKKRLADRIWNLVFIIIAAGVGVLFSKFKD